MTAATNVRAQASESRPAEEGGFFKRNALSLVSFGLFFLIFVVGQTLSGYRVYNSDQEEHGEQIVSYSEYLRTAHFGEATFENWESEFLQMSAYIVLTIWLRQKGSAESKTFDGSDEVDEDPAEHRNDPDAPWAVRHGGFALKLYKNSLALVFFALFIMSWVLHAATGAHNFSSEEVAHGGQPVTTAQYVTRAEFWFESMQNWQSEFLAVGSIVLLTVWLRQKGSPESKPVHSPHSKTGSE